VASNFGHEGIGGELTVLDPVGDILLHVSGSIDGLSPTEGCPVLLQGRLREVKVELLWFVLASRLEKLTPTGDGQHDGWRHRSDRVDLAVVVLLGSNLVGGHT